MKKSFFWKSYVAYAAVLLILIISATVAVNMVLTDYEAAQPERVVEQQIEIIKDAIANNKLEELDFVAQLEQGKYNVDSSAVAEFKEKIKNAKEFSYKVKTGSYSETGQTFYILADDEAMIEVTLESSNERVALAILTLSDWSVKAVEPAYTHYEVELPKDFELTINDNKVVATSDASSNEGWAKYEVDVFASEPEIKIFDAYGQAVTFRVKDEQIVPVVYSYELRFPKGFSVLVGEKTVEGVEDGDEMLYKFSTAVSELKLADAHGNTTDYKSGDAVYVYDYVVKIPENFKITINGKDASGYITSQVVDSKYQYCAEHANMPKLVTYEVKSAMKEPQCEIYDNLNQKVEVSFENNKIELLDQTPLATVPTDVINERELLDIAQIWSKFMTDDLTGAQHGFPTMSKYLIKNSYLYKVAYKWATSIDITFTSNHTLKTPPFTDEKITNFVSYGDNVYSCDISFKKHMYLVRTGETVIDEMNSTFYFMLYDGTNDGKDNPTWVILDIREIISK